MYENEINYTNVYRHKESQILKGFVVFNGRRAVVTDGDRVWTNVHMTSVSFVFEHEDMLYLEDYTPLNVAQVYGKCTHDNDHAFQPKEGGYSEVQAALARFTYNRLAAETEFANRLLATSSKQVEHA